MKKTFLFLGVISTLAFAVITDPSLSGTLQGRGLRASTSGQVKPVNNILYYEKGDNLTTMLTAIGSRKVTLVMDTIAAISDNTTIPANVNVQFSPYGGFNVATTKTLTILNMTPPGRYKVFYQSGTGNTLVPMGIPKFPEWWGAIPDGSTSSNAAFQFAILSKGELNCDTGTYILSATINMIDLQIVGKGVRAAGVGQTILKFNALDVAPAFTTRLADNSSVNSNSISHVHVLPNSWTPVTGSQGYGFDIESPITMTDVFVQSFFLSGIFLHGGVAGNGPYNSVFTNVLSEYNGQHGILVGTGANVLTFIQPYTAYNGATAYGVAPVAPGLYDGFRIQRDSAGNPGAAYQNYVPESIRIIGGNGFANSQYGWNFSQVTRSILEPGYAEGNLVNGVHQIYLGNDVQKCFINPAVVTGDSTGIVNNAAFYRRDNVLYVGGTLVGQGATRENWSYKNIKAYFGEASDSSAQAYISYDTTTASRALNIVGGSNTTLALNGGSKSLSIANGGHSFVGNMIWTTDNTYDIGANGATRPKRLFLSDTAIFGGAIKIVNNAATPIGSYMRSLVSQNATTGYAVQVYGNSIFPVITTAHARGTPGAETAIQSGDAIAYLEGAGYGSAWSGNNYMLVNATETWSGTARGYDIQFKTNLNTTTVGRTVLQLSNSLISIGEATNNTAITQVGTGLITLPGIVSNTNTTDATNSTTAALKTAGGIAAVKTIVSAANVVAAGATGITAGGSTVGAFTLGTAPGILGIYFGSGAPTITAGQGSLYLRTDGSTAVTRAYINTDGGTTWTAISTVL
jgi:hypothetical protein